MIINRKNKKSVEEGGNTLPSNLELRDFAQSIQALDLPSMHPTRRKAAIRVHLLKMAAIHLKDRDLGREIASSYLEHLRKAAN
jgi:hypothetical protein